jgi:hypothetical protein
MKLEVNDLKSSCSPEKGKKIHRTVRIASSQDKKVERLAEASGISFAEACRRLIQQGLETYGGRKL